MREEERVTVYQILHLYLIDTTMEVNYARTSRLLVKSVHVLRNEILQLAGRFQLGECGVCTIRQGLVQTPPCGSSRNNQNSLVSERFRA